MIPVVLGLYDFGNICNKSPGKLCSKPVEIEARTLSWLSPAAARDMIYK